MMKTPMPLLAALLLATLAMAQDATPTNALLVGLDACFTGAGDTNATVTTLKKQGWVQSDAEQGFIYMTGPDDVTIVTMDAEGYVCQTQSVDFGTDIATKVLASLLQANDITDIEYNKTDDGCTQLGLPDGTTATITSGGNDPTCGSETDSGIRFEFSQ
jgi:hypothetical protein